MSEHSRFRLIQMETALRRRGLSETVLDDDGNAKNCWLDVETPEHFMVFRWLDDGYEVDVSDLKGNVEFQIQKGASVDVVLGALVEKKIVPAAQG